MGRYLLAGSQQFGLMLGITQSLAGRTAFIELLPFSLPELNQAGWLPDNADTMLLNGCYPPLYDRNGNEIDLVVEQGTQYMPIEIKSGRTLTRESFAGLKKWCKLAGNTAVSPTLIYSGDETYGRREIKIVGWRECGILVQKKRCNRDPAAPLMVFAYEMIRRRSGLAPVFDPGRSRSGSS